MKQKNATKNKSFAAIFGRKKTKNELFLMSKLTNIFL